MERLQKTEKSKLKQKSKQITNGQKARQTKLTVSSTRQAQKNTSDKKKLNEK